MKMLILVALLCSACDSPYRYDMVESYVGDKTHLHSVSTENDRYNDCRNAIGQFADPHTDMWEEQMDSCVFHDPDYLKVPFEVGEEQ